MKVCNEFLTEIESVRKSMDHNAWILKTAKVPIRDSKNLFLHFQECFAVTIFRLSQSIDSAYTEAPSVTVVIGFTYTLNPCPPPSVPSRQFSFSDERKVR